MPKSLEKKTFPTEYIAEKFITGERKWHRIINLRSFDRGKIFTNQMPKENMGDTSFGSWNVRSTNMGEQRNYQSRSQSSDSDFYSRQSGVFN